MVTFIFTDIENWTDAMQRLGPGYQESIDDLRRLLQEAFKKFGGEDIRAEGTNVLAAFSDPAQALEAAASGQLALAHHVWPQNVPLRARMAVHSGEATDMSGRYVGLGLNETARICAISNGGQILVSEVTQRLTAAALPIDQQLLHAGRHMLKDFTRPWDIYQLTHPGLQADFPRVGGKAVHLPPVAGRLIGQEQGIESATQALLGGTRILTFTGPPGIGKTRMTIEVASILANRYPDGVWYLDVSQLDSESDLFDTLHRSIQPSTDLAPFFQANRCIIILDGFEHVMESAPALSALLAAPAQSCAIVASCEALAITGELAIPVAPLTPPAQSGSSAVEFLEASVQQAGGHLDSQRYPDAVSEICSQLDCLPLALEAAAKQLNHTTPQALLHEITSTDPMAITWLGPVFHAYERLWISISPEEAMLLARLSTFSSDFSVSDVEERCADDAIPVLRILVVLDSLSAKGLVQQGNAPGKLMLQRLVRSFAQSKLAPRRDTASSA